MADQRQIDIYSAGCAVCDEAVKLVNELACPSCNVSVLDMHDAEVARRAATLGIAAVPAVVIDGVPADCCAGRGIKAEALRAAGIGQPLP